MNNPKPQSAFHSKSVNSRRHPDQRQHADPLNYNHPWPSMAEYAIRLRRYRIPVKLLYCCGLRLSECLSITVKDIHGKEGKLFIRGGKGNKDRMVPLPAAMLKDLRDY